MSRLRGNRRTKETWNIDEATSDNHTKERPSNDFSTRNIRNNKQIRGMPLGFNEIIILNF